MLCGRLSIGWGCFPFRRSWGRVTVLIGIVEFKIFLFIREERTTSTTTTTARSSTRRTTGERRTRRPRRQRGGVFKY